MLVWERPEPPSRPAPTPLSRASIVRAAIDLADTEGLDAVSLRKVGAALGAGPMRLYGYIATKEELLDLMVDEVYGEMPPPGADALRDRALAIRDAVRRHEWFADLMGGRPQIGPNALANLDATLAAVGGADDPASAWRAVGAVSAYAIGAVRQEVAEGRAARVSGQSEDEWRRSVAPYLTGVLDRYPTLAHVITSGPDEDPDATFATGLEFVLAGIRARTVGG
ncbi:TetR/AcrR family transcriptional regulator [Cryptosporangium phraense]|uniref:TetR/AcrR family transcriptional regulator n=1 Tax=Cryptosporangium phraense TaxID=2593070 RepID=A0A545AM21_9ACTN|nr:TetR/AcrR family transcriptional regulator C-terminal domain-containing protein [Cryptosporangium phraense]TQS42372.1 TetR/AcrR family transcriptional regulator [Cryptosporangium phraense]